MLCLLGKNFPNERNCTLVEIRSHSGCQLLWLYKFLFRHSKSLPIAKYCETNIMDMNNMISYACICHLLGELYFRTLEGGCNVVNRLENTIGSYDIYVRYRFNAPNHQILTLSKIDE